MEEEVGVLQLGSGDLTQFESLWCELEAGKMRRTPWECDRIGRPGRQEWMHSPAEVLQVNGAEMGVTRLVGST